MEASGLWYRDQNKQGKGNQSSQFQRQAQNYKSNSCSSLCVDKSLGQGQVICWHWAWVSTITSAISWVNHGTEQDSTWPRKQDKVWIWCQSKWDRKEMKACQKNMEVRRETSTSEMEVRQKWDGSETEIWPELKPETVQKLTVQQSQNVQIQIL